VTYANTPVAATLPEQVLVARTQIWSRISIRFLPVLEMPPRTLPGSLEDRQPKLAHHNLREAHPVDAGKLVNRSAGQSAVLDGSADVVGRRA